MCIEALTNLRFVLVCIRMHTCMCVCVHMCVCVCTETVVRREIKDGRIIIAKDVKILDYIVSH